VTLAAKGFPSLEIVPEALQGDTAIQPLQLPPPPPPPPPPPRPGTADASQVASVQAAPSHPEDVRPQEAAQDFLQAVFALADIVDIRDSVGKEVDNHFRALAKIRATRRAQNCQEHRLRMEEIQDDKFLERMDKMFARELKRLPDAEAVRQHLNEYLQKCSGHLEVLGRSLCMVDGYEVEDGVDPLDPSAVEARRAAAATKPRPRDSELRPLHEWRVMDIDVAFAAEGLANTATSSTSASSLPAWERTIIFSNLPPEATADQIRKALEYCGPLQYFEMCSEWIDWSASLSSKQPVANLEDGEAAGGSSGVQQPSSPSPRYTMLYAIAEFATPEGHSNATREALRVFGILFGEVEVSFTKSGKRKSRRVARPAFPQAAAAKHSLLLRGFPWYSRPRVVLEECARKLDGEGLPACTLQLMNCPAHWLPLESLAVMSDGDGSVSTQQSPPSLEPWGGSLSSLAAVLRFRSFQEAFLARQALQGLRVHGGQSSARWTRWGGRLQTMCWWTCPSPG